MSKIKALKTGDVFEAPAADFEGEADFQVVDDSTPVTLSVPPGNGTAPTVGDASAPVGATDSSVGEPVLAVDASTGAASGDAVSGTDTASGLTSGEVGNVTGLTDASVGTAATDVVGPSSLSDSPASIAPVDVVGNVAAGVDDSASVASVNTTDTQAADNATPVATPGTPPTDSVNASPTGGPTPGNGATLDAKSKHLVATQLEADVLFAIAQLVTVTPSLQHAADAFFAQVTSQIDVEAAA